MNAWASAFKICKDFADENPAYDFEVFDFDSNVIEKEYPNKNLIGVYDFEYAELDGLAYLSFAIGISPTKESMDNHNLNEVTGKLVRYVARQSRHEFVDYESKASVGLLVALDDLNVSPLTKTSLRQFKFVLQRFVYDRGLS